MWRKWFIFLLTVSSAMQASEPKIAVVGAGLAGLTAALRLHQAGVDVEVFEALDVAGGRVKTLYEGESYEELGGKFFYDGSEALALKELVSELGLKIKEYTLPWSIHYLKDGKPTNYLDLFKDAPELTEENYQALQQQVEEEHFLAVFRRYLGAHPDLMRIIELRIACYEGTKAEYLDNYYFDQMCSYYELFYHLAHDEQFASSGGYNQNGVVIAYVEGGNAKLVAALSKKLAGRIHYSTPVKKLSELGNFDACIFAIPCTTLREIDFGEGSLPQDQLEAIQTLQYSTVNKILVDVSITSKAPSFAIGSEFISWLNEDQSIMTLYLGGFADHNHPSLEKYLPEITLLYPGIKIIGAPTIANWVVDPYSKGSYSNFGLDQYERFNEIDLVDGIEVKHLFRPIDERIYFAGEHTAFKEFATMEGAVISGNNAAHLILRKLKKIP